MDTYTCICMLAKISTNLALRVPITLQKPGQGQQIFVVDSEFQKTQPLTKYVQACDETSPSLVFQWLLWLCSSPRISITTWKWSIPAITPTTRPQTLKAEEDGSKQYESQKHTFLLTMSISVGRNTLYSLFFFGRFSRSVSSSRHQWGKQTYSGRPTDNLI